MTFKGDSGGTGVADELEVEEEKEENEVFIAYDIASYPSDLTLSVIYEMWNKDDIEIPEFQRNFVWSIRQASLLIESFLMGLPVPQVFFYIDDENRNLVIDGQQRISSVVYYLDGFFGSENIEGKRQVFRLQGLDERSPYADKSFEELPEAGKRKLTSAVLRAINIRQLNPREPGKIATSVYHIFERLNTGGTPLKPQEIRNCVFRGQIVSSLRELNQDKAWRQIVGKTTLDKHQKDVELILRIYSLINNVAGYEKPMKEFLNKAMSSERSAESEKFAHFQKTFPIVSAKIVDVLGAKPFHVRGPLNSSALDAVFCILFENQDKFPADLPDRYRRLRADDAFVRATQVSTSDAQVVRERFALTKRYLVD